MSFEAAWSDHSETLAVLLLLHDGLCGNRARARACIYIHVEGGALAVSHCMAQGRFGSLTSCDTNTGVAGKLA